VLLKESQIGLRIRRIFSSPSERCKSSCCASGTFELKQIKHFKALAQGSFFCCSAVRLLFFVLASVKTAADSIDVSHGARCETVIASCRRRRFVFSPAQLNIVPVW